jgi:hypothetical protein
MSDRDAAAQPGELVPIASVYSQPEAAVLFATLRAYGFLAFRFDDDTLYVSPWWMVALGGIRIMVPRHQWEDAAALLAEIDEGWTCPPRPFADEPWVSRAMSLIIFFMCTGAPPPRVRGDYAWRSPQTESGSPGR